MNKKIIPLLMLLFSITEANAQVRLMKMVGNNTDDYQLGYGAFIKTGFPVTEGSNITLEAGINIFNLSSDYGEGDGTIMCPVKVGYRYSLNQTNEGFYVEPQAGYNLYGVTSLHDYDLMPRDLKYNGIVLAAGTGYLFSLWNQPFDLNLRYETVIAKGGSNNYISLGISRFISFKKRDY